MKYKFILSNDKSPTIDYFQNSEQSETMHNRVGAYTETLYIYHHALAQTTERQWPLKVLSVGLGLGYNELLTAAHALKSGVLSDTYIESFEIEVDLRTAFQNWLSNSEKPEEADFYQCYQTICQLLEETFQVSADDIRSALKSLKENGQWILREGLDSSVQFNQSFNCILYDAYSSHTSPELWDEEFIYNLLSNCAQSQCLLSTYAAKGTLTRALKRHEFKIEKREGFGGKRQSTFAVRD